MVETREPKLRSCPLCSSEKISFRYRITRYKEPFSVSLCAECGFMFMNPPCPTQNAEELYGREYYSGEAEYSYYDERINEKFSAYVWDSRIRFIRRFKAEGNLLDVGCSFGGLMNRAASCFNVYGIDLSPYAGARAAERFPGKIHIGTLHNHPFREDSFSVITMIELLEHEADPLKALRECYSLLETGGVIVIQTANFLALQAALKKERYAYFMPGHLSYFTSLNLEHALKSCGFRKVKIYYPVEFGLLPKLLKSRMNFRKITHYLAWIRIALYHLAGKLRFRGRGVMSSMVVYAVK